MSALRQLGVSPPRGSSGKAPKPRAEARRSTPGESSGKGPKEEVSVPDPGRRRQKAKPIKETDLRRHYEQLKEIPTRGGTGYGSYSLPGPRSKPQRESDRGSEAESGPYSAPLHEGDRLGQQIHALSFLPSEDDSGIAGTKTEEAGIPTARRAAELSEAVQEACAAWERDHAYEIANSPINPRYAGEGSTDEDQDLRCRYREPGLFGYAPPGSEVNWNDDGTIDSDEPWF